MRKYLILLLSAYLVSACSSLRVSYDYDSQANFANFKTYRLTEESRNLPVTDLDRNRLIAAVEAELAAKGFSRSDNPEVLVDLYVKKEQRQRATANTMHTGMGGMGMGMGMGGMGMGPMWGMGGMGMGGGFSTTQINYHKYVEGTLFINLVEVTSNQLAWQGRATKTLAEKASAKKRTKNINSAVKAIFTKYPPKSKRSKGSK